MYISDTLYVESESGNEHGIIFEVDCSVENDGIGSYEYWGMKGYDRGVNYLVPDGKLSLWMMSSRINPTNGMKVYSIENKRKLARSNRIIDDAIEKYLENYRPEPEGL